MKILIVNKFLYERGGAETYALAVGKMLSDKGHSVQYYGIADERNIVGNDCGIYADNRDLTSGFFKNLKAPFEIISSRKNYKQMLILLNEFKPDVVHLNNIQYYLTPSIIEAVGRYRSESGNKAKLIYTTHDFQLICPNHGLLDGNYNRCEDCIGGKYTNCVKKRCVKNSYLRSVLGMLDAYHWKRSKAYSYVDTYLCPSYFMKSKLDSETRFAGKTTVIHNPIERPVVSSRNKGEYIVYFGKLCKDKGTYTLIDAIKDLPSIKLMVAGYGPAEEDIAKLSNVEFVGFKKGEELVNLISGALFSVYPSECNENCPYSVLESQIYGTPIIASRIGGIPELIDEGNTGLLFEPGDSIELHNLIEKLWGERELLNCMTDNCRSVSFETNESYFDKLEKLYTE